MNIEKLDIPKLSELEWQELYDFTAELFAELFPGETNINLDYVKRVFNDTHDDFVNDHYIIKEGNKIIAKARFSYAKPTSLTKETDTDNVNIDIRVRKQYRRKKLATGLLSYLLMNQFLGRHKRVYLSASGSPGYEFCDNFDGKVTFESFESKLFFDKADWANIENLNSQAKEKSKEMTVEITEDINPENESEYFNIFCDMFEELSKNHVDWIFNREYTMNNLRESRKKEKADGIKTLIAWTRDKKGRLIGISELIFSQDRKEKLITSLSGVVKEHRKKGLCMRMKTDLLLYATKYLPDAKFVWTENDKGNDSMRGINAKLGFVPDEPSRSYLYKTDELKKKLGIL